MTTPLDLEWARRCAKDFADKPTEARARNAAQCLAGLLDAYDTAIGQLAAQGRLLLPPEVCREVYTDPNGLEFQCFLAHRHDGDHSDNVMHEPPTTWPRAATAPCTAEGWHRPGIDPCPARSHQNETCLKGYLHTGGHEWGGIRPIIAGPELPVNDCTPCPATREDSYDHKTLTCIRQANHDGRHKMRTGAESYLEWSDLTPPGTLTDPSEDPDQRSHNCRCTVGIQPRPVLELDSEHWRCRFPGCENPTEDPQHLHGTNPWGMYGPRGTEVSPVSPTGDATEPRTGVGG